MFSISIFCWFQIRKLTCGYLDGIKQKIEISKLVDTLTVDTYLKRKKKEKEAIKLQGMKCY